MTNISAFWTAAARWSGRVDFNERHQSGWFQTQSTAFQESILSAHPSQFNGIALTLDDSLVEAHFNLADLQSETDQLDAAVSSYEKALTLQPDLVEAHYNLGMVLKDLGRHDESAAAHQRAVTLAPELFYVDGETHH